MESRVQVSLRAHLAQCMQDRFIACAMQTLTCVDDILCIHHDPDDKGVCAVETQISWESQCVFGHEA